MSTSGAAKQLVIRSQEGASDVLIAVEDCGIGVAPEITDKIFDPFFTTKAHGIGMGLSISRSIIESHDGKLWATRNDHGGATFLFTLPIAIQDSDG
jgi:signal transduction histidine kinase